MIASAKTVTTKSYSDATCSTETDAITQSFSEYGMGTCDSAGIKYVCTTRAPNKYIPPSIRALAETAVDFIFSFF